MTIAKGAILKGIDQPLVVEELEWDEPKPDEVGVRVLASGVCHTNYHVIKGEYPKVSIQWKFPFYWDMRAWELSKKSERIAKESRSAIMWSYRGCPHAALVHPAFQALCNSVTEGQI